MEYKPWIARHRCQAVLSVYETPGRLEWESLINSPLSSGYLNCTIQAVLEPMKVRVISKGEALPYYLTKVIQESLHTTLRKIPCFRLIGRPFCQTDLLDLVKKAPVGSEWFSIDYSAATDGLSWKYSGKIFESIISVLPEDLRETCMQVLGPHRLHYPVHGDRKVGEFRGVMKRGQLMGSILSFPILCLANLGVYLATIDQVASSWAISETLNHVLINGDDMLYAAPPSLWKVHEETGRRVGLNLSVGKAYHHKVYSNINSIACHYDLDRADRVLPRRIDFLNVGLLFGQHKVQSKDGQATSHHETQGSIPCLSEVLQGCFRNRAGICSLYMNLHREGIQMDSLCQLITRDSWRVRTFTRNIFLPISVGGLGIKAPKGFKYRISPIQRLVARHLVAKAIQDGFTINSCRPLLGYEPEVFLSNPARPWCSKVKNVDAIEILPLKKIPDGVLPKIGDLLHTGFLASVRNRHHSC